MSSAAPESLITALARVGYRLAYLALRGWWFVRRPRTNGAAVALWHGGKVLMVRTSYRDCYSLPGGFVRRGEPSDEAACRELREEVGISLPPGTLRRAWHGAIRFESRQDTIDIWEATVDPLPAFRISGREIIWADWVTPAEVSGRPMLPHLAEYLDRVAGQ